MKGVLHILEDDLENLYVHSWDDLYKWLQVWTPDLHQTEGE